MASALLAAKSGRILATSARLGRLQPHLDVHQHLQPRTLSLEILVGRRYYGRLAASRTFQHAIGGVRPNIGPVKPIIIGIMQTRSIAGPGTAVDFIPQKDIGVDVPHERPISVKDQVSSQKGDPAPEALEIPEEFRALGSSSKVTQEGDVIDLSSFAVPDPPKAPTGAEASEALEMLKEMAEMPELSLAEVMPVSWLSCWLGWPLREYIGLLHGFLPWWGAIALCTLTVRVLLFPLYLKAQTNMGKFNEVMPKYQYYEQRKTEAQMSGNHLEVVKWEFKQQELYRVNKINPMAAFWPTFAQTPFFLTFLSILRKLAKSGLPSVKAGGALWFTDLTQSDPYYALPIITCSTLFLCLELGAESGKKNVEQKPIVKYVLRAIPLIIFPMIYSFPCTVLVYWCTNNAISLLQVIFFKKPAVRKFLRLPPLIKHSEQTFKPPGSDKGFKQNMKDMWEKRKVVQKLNEKARLDEMAFKKAGIGPIKKTFAYDPTKVKNPLENPTAGAQKR